MKRVTASEARRNWFRLLDEAAAGATIVIERAGRRILLVRERTSGSRDEVPDYSGLLRVPDAGDADRWGWNWGEEGGETTLVDLGTEPDDGGTPRPGKGRGADR